MRLLILPIFTLNIAALRAIEKDAGAVDAIYCAGDYVDYGTDPHEAIGWVRGTRRALRHGQPRQASAQHPVFGRGGCVPGTNRYKWVHDNCERVTDEDIAFLAALPQHMASF